VAIKFGFDHFKELAMEPLDEIYGIEIIPGFHCRLLVCWRWVRMRQDFK
jgi:hypothetical protein